MDNDCSCFCHNCHKYDKLFNEFQYTKAKESDLRKRISDLNALLLKLKTENQILEQQNKILINSCQNPLNCVPEDKNVHSAKIIKAIDEFDFMLEKQSSDMCVLIEERNKLMNITFKSLQLIDKQNMFIDEYKKTIISLLNYINGQESTMDLMNMQLNKLGINAYPYLTLFEQRRGSFPGTTNDISNDEFQRMMDSISRLGRTNNSDIRRITQFIINKRNLESELRAEISEQKSKIERYQNQFKALFKALHLKRDCFDLAMKKLKAYKGDAKGACEAFYFAIDLVNVVLNFAQRYQHDSDVSRCSMRLQKWLEDGDKKIDVIQEIDFLLGIFCSEKKQNNYQEM